MEDSENKTERLAEIVVQEGERQVAKKDTRALDILALALSLVVLHNARNLVIEKKKNAKYIEELKKKKEAKDIKNARFEVFQEILFGVLLLVGSLFCLYGIIVFLSRFTD